MGTTSACAENTPRVRGRVPPYRNYLRVRGEYWRIISMMEVSMELPPRARRIRLTYHGEPIHLGTTSACAENTNNLRTDLRPTRNYLRVRGEYTATGCTVITTWELPPRARRIQAFCFLAPSRIGTTSACAENTLARECFVKQKWNYLRVRGEYNRPF